MCGGGQAGSMMCLVNRTLYNKDDIIFFIYIGPSPVYIYVYYFLEPVDGDDIFIFAYPQLKTSLGGQKWWSDCLLTTPTVGAQSTVG